jgi:hypothetical protein
MYFWILNASSRGFGLDWGFGGFGFGFGGFGLGLGWRWGRLGFEAGCGGVST